VVHSDRPKHAYLNPDYEADEKNRKTGSEQKSLQCNEKWTYVICQWKVGHMWTYVKEQYKQWSKIEESKIQEDKNVKSRSRKLGASVTPALLEAEKVTPATSRLEASLIFTPPPLMGYPQPYHFCRV
jgi:hypothetical protein